MRSTIHRSLVVAAATAGLFALGAGSAQADDGGATASSGSPSAEIARAVGELGGKVVPGMPEGVSLEVPGIVPGVPSIGILPMSLPGLPVTPTIPLP